jgi:hypothetical protein
MMTPIRRSKGGDMLGTNQSPTSVSYNHSSLGELALDAAIELERAYNQEPTDLGSVSKLAKSLENDLDDLSLFPIYKRALSSSASQPPTTTSDVYKLLREFSAQMTAKEERHSEIVRKLRDFCLALHGSLLTLRIDSVASNARSDER